MGCNHEGCNHRGEASATFMKGGAALDLTLEYISHKDCNCEVRAPTTVCNRMIRRGHVLLRQGSEIHTPTYEDSDTNTGI